MEKFFVGFEEEEIYVGSSKLSTAGTTTIPRKVRAKARWMLEDEFNYYINKDGDIVIRNITKKELITPGTDYLAKVLDEIFSGEQRIIFFTGSKPPYYPPAIMAAYIQLKKGKFKDGTIEFTENCEVTYEEYAVNNKQLLNNLRAEDKLLYREVIRYKSDEKNVTLYLINSLSNPREIIEEIPEILEKTNAKIIVLGINNHNEYTFKHVKNYEEYLRISYFPDKPLTVDLVNVVKDTAQKLNY